MITVRDYCESDWDSIRRIHDAARMNELKLAGLEEAFLPLEISAEREDLFGYQGIFVAESESGIVGFTACSDDELAWLYVDPKHIRQGIGKALAEHAIKEFPEIRYAEALAGNEPAKALYESIGFVMAEIVTGKMPGNETFDVEVYRFERKP